MPENDSHQHVVKTSAQWDERAVQYWVVPRGCLCIELVNPKLTKIKVGEGNKFYHQLPYIGELSDLSDYYTKEEVDNILNNLNYMAVRSTEEYETSADLPRSGNKLGDVRFVKSPSPSIKTDPDTYIWNGRKWLFVGNPIQDIDLSEYVKQSDFKPVKQKVDEMYPKMHEHPNMAVLNATEKPFTTDDKTKLDSLQNYEPFTGTDGYISGKEGLVPTPQTSDEGKFLSANGQWETVSAADDYIGATEDSPGVHGLVPAAASEERAFFLRGDGTWTSPESAVIPIATDEEVGGIKVSDDFDIAVDGTLTISTLGKITLHCNQDPDD